MSQAEKSSKKSAGKNTELLGSDLDNTLDGWRQMGKVIYKSKQNPNKIKNTKSLKKIFKLLSEFYKEWQTEPNPSEEECNLLFFDDCIRTYSSLLYNLTKDPDNETKKLELEQFFNEANLILKYLGMNTFRSDEIDKHSQPKSPERSGVYDKEGYVEKAIEEFRPKFKDKVEKGATRHGFLNRNPTFDHRQKKSLVIQIKNQDERLSCLRVLEPTKEEIEKYYFERFKTQIK